MIRPVWPTAAQYREAIADPQAIGRADLRSGRVELGSGGIPKIYTGSSSTTFRIAIAGGDVALRCFNYGSGEPQRRYAAISELSRYAHNDALCRTEYEDEAIRVDGTPWPAVIMEWISGRSLDAEIATHVGHDGGGDALVRLATHFREVVRALGALGIAHGDLQHRNILVENDRIRLIDYDAMYLPAIADLATSEFGHRNYQHPKRREAPFDARLDRFSSLVIYTSLIALASDRTLWSRFNDGDNLLFRAHDFTSNGRSELFRALFADNATSGLADVFRAACVSPVTETPSLEAAIAACASTMSVRAVVARPKPREGPKPVRARTRGLLARVALAMTLIGLAIGFAMAALHGRTAPQVASRGSIARRIPLPLRTTFAPSPIVRRTAAPTVAPTTTVVPVSRIATRDLTGTWTLAEANDRVGTIVWAGEAVATTGRTIVLDVRKSSVAGRSATPCERQTFLHAEFAVGVGRQTVPYRETNCAGASSGGEIRVRDLGNDAGSFSGSIWQGDAKLGDFTAIKR